MWLIRNIREGAGERLPFCASRTVQLPLIAINRDM
jgi:hypothetical protein